MKNLKYLLSIGLFVISINCFAQKPSKVIPVAQFYPGGQDSMYAFINRNLVYPITAKKNRIQGECIVDMTIEADGKLSSVSIVKNIGAGCGEKAVEVVKKLKFKAPGYKFQTSMPVIFKL